MSELRARVAAIIDREMCWNAPLLSEHLADALIRELGLHVVMVGDFQTVIKGSYPKPFEEHDD